MAKRNHLFPSVNFKPCQHALLMAENRNSYLAHTQKWHWMQVYGSDIDPWEAGLGGWKGEEEKGKNEAAKKNKIKRTQCGLCDSSHRTADPSVGSNQRLRNQNKHRFHRIAVPWQLSISRKRKRWKRRREGGGLCEGQMVGDGFITDAKGQLSIKGRAKKK